MDTLQRPTWKLFRTMGHTCGRIKLLGVKTGESLLSVSCVIQPLLPAQGTSKSSASSAFVAYNSEELRDLAPLKVRAGLCYVLSCVVLAPDGGEV